MGMVGQRVVNGVWQKVVQWMLRKQMVQRVDGRLRGRWGGNNGEKKVCFKMHFRQKKVFLDHVFFFNPPVGTTGGFYIWKILSVILSVRFFEKFEDIYLFKGDI